jgi:hypothetical protein
MPSVRRRLLVRLCAAIATSSDWLCHNCDWVGCFLNLQALQLI